MQKPCLEFDEFVYYYVEFKVASVKYPKLVEFLPFSSDEINITKNNKPLNE